MPHGGSSIGAEQNVLVCMGSLQAKSAVLRRARCMRRPGALDWIQLAERETAMAGECTQRVLRTTNFGVTKVLEAGTGPGRLLGSLVPPRRIIAPARRRGALPTSTRGAQRSMKSTSMSIRGRPALQHRQSIPTHSSVSKGGPVRPVQNRRRRPRTTARGSSRRRRSKASQPPAKRAAKQRANAPCERVHADPMRHRSV